MDLTVLVTDRDSVPMHTGAVVIFEGPPPGADEVRALLHERVPGIPRLRQTLRRTPIGCGRPIWVDDPDFSIDRHLTRLDWPAPDSDRSLFDVATGLLCRPLPADWPLWSATVVTSGERAALVVVLHHVLADGLGGLAILAALADERSGAGAVRAFPRRPPTVWQLAGDATGEKWRALRALPGDLRRGWAGLHELGIGRGVPRRAERISLVRPTSRRRELARVTAGLDDVVAVAHRHGGTVNDVVLAAVTGAMLDGLHARGEWPGHLVVSVPVSGRDPADAGSLGNNTGVRPIVVPAVTDDAGRLAGIVAATAATRRTVRASSAAPLGWAFRALHRTGLFAMFIRHQRLVHTFETNVRGPASALHIGGHRIGALVPMVATPGNVGVTFAALSYAGNLVVSMITDPDLVPERDAMAGALHRSFARLAAAK
ncbi:diacylglycerol O-acyltransferase [Paractinoplanes rishiriensis]|uniref:diacylglycerol O-acyltransferase n=2 Tax=Paractinoplanes rishiriensis TaxID=1050105 RepID=A0A919KB25_9ACTN|nr:diacylglycerol O-acyltransferase [Actinoplanes rishiriensis]